MHLDPSLATSYQHTAEQRPRHQEELQCRFGHKPGHVHDEFCHHHDGSHHQDLPPSKATGSIIQRVGQWLNRLWTSLKQDLQALVRFFKRQLGFKATEPPAPPKHKHSDHCNHAH